jgi:hypothetical protein
MPCVGGPAFFLDVVEARLEDLLTPHAGALHLECEDLVKTARVALLSTLTFSLLAAADPFVGTWELNTRKSKFAPGGGYFSATIQIESMGKGLKSSASGADSEGLGNSLTFSCQLDGTPCKVTQAIVVLRSESAVDTVSLKRIDPNTIVATGTRNGKPVYSDRRVVSDDGKTMTIFRDGTKRDGTNYRSTLVLDRLR